MDLNLKMMKNKKEILQNGKQVVVLFFLLWISSFYHSCMDEELIAPVEGEIDIGTEAVLLININTPETSIPTAQTRTQTENEYQVSEIDVLVFNQQNGVYVFDYRVKGEDLSPNGAQTQFMALLVTTEDPVKLYVLANAAVALEEDPITVGMSEELVRQSLVMDFTSAGMEVDLPMFGEHEFVNGLSSTTQQTVTVDVLRAIARVDVVTELEPESGEFALDFVYAFRANDLIQVIPSGSAYGTTLRVNAPSVPSAARLLENYVINGNEAVNDSIGQLYLPESTGTYNDSEKLMGKTTIVVGGRFKGSSTVSYYRIDFDSGLSGHPFGQILRNHRYVFIIKSVLSEGWATPEIAANNIATSMLVETVTWEDFSSEIVLTGDERFGISGREISLRYVKDREKSLYVESTFDYTIQWIENGEPVGESTSARDTEIQNDDFSARIVHDNTDHADVTRLVFKTLKHNHNGAGIITDTLRISVGGVWVMDIAVKQDNAAKFSNRTVNVMSVGQAGLYGVIYRGYGDLGTNAATHGANGDAMRNIIDTQFKQNAAVPIGGSYFSRISVDDANTTSATNIPVVERVIDIQDVIYLTYNIVLSTQIAEHLFNWYNASPFRVLIIATDSEGSNAAIRGNDVIKTDLDWHYNDIATIAPNNLFIRAAESDGSDDFFNGPFGEVAYQAGFRKVDNNAGYTMGTPSGVTPLVTGSAFNSLTYMIFGVNKDKRIIYHGDADLFTSAAMGNNNGLIESELDKLMANMWAWVVEQVIYGDQ